MNGDGIADSIGSSQNANAANGSLTGQAHVFLGSNNIGNIPTNGGDLDGSHGAAFTGAFAAIFLVLISMELAYSIEMDLTAFVSSQGVRINGAVANDRVGYGASNAGDVNGDGFDDIILG